MNQATRKEKEKLLRIRMTKLQTMWGSRIPLDDNWRHLHELTDERLDEDLTNTVDHLRFEKTLNIITAIGKVALLAFLALAVILLLFVMSQMF
jgi:hypothetical protein